MRGLAYLLAPLCLGVFKREKVPLPLASLWGEGTREKAIPLRIKMQTEFLGAPQDRARVTETGLGAPSGTRWQSIPPASESVQAQAL